MTSNGTARGPGYVRATLRAHLLERLPLLVPYLRGEWDDGDAFPPAGPEDGATEVPEAAEQVRTTMGRPQDRWPLAQIELGTAQVRRASIETTDGTDSVVYFVTYTVQAFVWVDVTPPESVELEEEREFATDVRDDLQMAMRYALLDVPGIGDDPPLVVLPTTYSEDYGEPQAAGGQRWTVGGRARFSLRAQERLSRLSLATVTEDDPEIDYGITTHTVPVDHPALQ